jgi:hypothetical protein
MPRRMTLSEESCERAVAEARLADLLQCESALQATHVVAKERMERQLPAFARASQNMATMAALLDALPAPSTDGVGKVYQRLKSILSAAAYSRRSVPCYIRSRPLFCPLPSPPPPPRPRVGDRGPSKELQTGE